MLRNRFLTLDRLCTDRIDLIQFHALIHPDEWEQALSAGGALEVAIKARDQGLVRFIGDTGYGWNSAAMHRRSLIRFNFDSVLMPWNYFAPTPSNLTNGFLSNTSDLQGTGCGGADYKIHCSGTLVRGCLERELYLVSAS